MSKPINEPFLHQQVAENKFKIKDTRQWVSSTRWWEPECIVCPGVGCYDECRGNEPGLQNSWQQPSPPLQKFAFRLHRDGSLEFRGHLDASGGATSGTVAVTLPGTADPDTEPNFVPSEDQYFHTAITTDDGSTFQIALVFLDSSNGEVTITWPAS
jgi:hypothetical protein